MNHLRDAFLAAASGGILLAALASAGSLGLLASPAAVATGVLAALAVEGLFIADTPAGDLWERSWVRGASVAALLGGSAALAWLTGAWILAAVCWGLATYFCLLALVLVGAWGGDASTSAGED